MDMWIRRKFKKIKSDVEPMNQVQEKEKVHETERDVEGRRLR